MSEIAQMVALCDVNSRSLEAAAAQFPGARTYKDFRELHTKMDQHLATAVNQLSGSITNLEEVLDEFIEALPAKR